MRHVLSQPCQPRPDCALTGDMLRKIFDRPGAPTGYVHASTMDGSHTKQSRTVGVGPS
jgi:hypothetical protein